MPFVGSGSQVMPQHQTWFRFNIWRTLIIYSSDFDFGHVGVADPRL